MFRRRPEPAPQDAARATIAERLELAAEAATHGDFDAALAIWVEYAHAGVAALCNIAFWQFCCALVSPGLVGHQQPATSSQGKGVAEVAARAEPVVYNL